MRRYLLPMLTVALIAAAAGFGMLKRSTYTDIKTEPDYMEQLQVAELSGHLAAAACSEMMEALPACSIILRVQPVGEMEYMYLAGRQKVCIQEVYAGEGLEAGEEIYITSAAWCLSLENEPESVEMGFVNVMSEGDDYLIFLTERVEDFHGIDPVYRLCADYLITPVFCYIDRDNVIMPVGTEHTYVPYVDVKDNEFFAADEEGLTAWETLKASMLSLYPAQG